MTRRADPAQATLFDADAPAGAPTATGGFIPLADQFNALPADWKTLLEPCLARTDWPALCAFVDGERAAGKPIFPTEVFHALHLTPVDGVRVVILGQDPYHGTGTVDGREVPQAHGLAFSVPAGVRVPPSLRNIYKEIEAEYGHKLPAGSGNLEGWAQQGVLLLNTVLTVEQGQAASHARRGWERITDCLLEHLARVGHPRAFMLWGSHAQAKRALLPEGHLVLEAPHPSPLSAHRGFLGCGHFRAANDWLAAQGQTTIDWLKPQAG
ncbi:uracil-DNA glycosylase [Ralstonia solanacearum]|uniref:uracil-DNA glycosylase n=1 Tax=Ralstonia solanacearum TaxID=305 RepID=UPI0001816324|nr:uracil-DNA glycosylase [Ralstonia solanacearum]MDC6179380.1 uracil-DNA glycosylase [Ralstonia solanacearum]MDC6209611.1 uracil-DNA glycosylase [Ralstonia solanacearum]MDC6240648.1 uracil-DNA glycosylase [Ralstonia solanacearum]MDD7800018.1 uracil-DNA glycosylase [Ralstonia solanacearum]QHB55827.1 uracil-DNA glycosylase [Ralstonia solanacearum]